MTASSGTNAVGGLVPTAVRARGYLVDRSCVDNFHGRTLSSLPQPLTRFLTVVSFRAETKDSQCAARGTSRFRNSNKSFNSMWDWRMHKQLLKHETFSISGLQRLHIFTIWFLSSFIFFATLWIQCGNKKYISVWISRKYFICVYELF